MTVTSNVNTVATAIAGLSISGVTIKDINAIPDSVQGLCPIIVPQPNNFMTSANFTFETFGTMGTAKMNFEYDLNYAFLFCEVGSGPNAYADYSAMMTKLALILVTIFSNDMLNGLVTMSLGTVGNIGKIVDPADNEFWGVLFSLHCLEYAQ